MIQKQLEQMLRLYLYEYNETEGIFHQNFGDKEPDTNGYKTVCETRESIWRPFRNMLDRRYDFETNNRPTFEIIQKEWEDYIKLRTDIKDYNDKEKKAHETLKH